MPRLSPLQRHAKERQRRLDGSLWRKKLAHELVDHSIADEGDDDDEGNDYQFMQGPVAATHVADGFTFTEREYVIQQLHAKRWVNEVVYYLVQWVGYSELTWEPRTSLPWKIVARFELDTIESVWLYQSTRGRRRVKCIKRGTRRSNRLRGMSLFYISWFLSNVYCALQVAQPRSWSSSSATDFRL